jgi:hypothetical protein
MKMVLHAITCNHVSDLVITCMCHVHVITRSLHARNGMYDNVIACNVHSCNGHVMHVMACNNILGFRCRSGPAVPAAALAVRSASGHGNHDYHDLEPRVPGSGMTCDDFI